MYHEIGMHQQCYIGVMGIALPHGAVQLLEVDQKVESSESPCFYVHSPGAIWFSKGGKGEQILTRNAHIVCPYRKMNNLQCVSHWL